MVTKAYRIPITRFFIHMPIRHSDIHKTGTSTTHTTRSPLKMAAKLVRIKIPSKLLAHIDTPELHQHIQNELGNLPCNLPPDVQDRTLGKYITVSLRQSLTLGDDLVFLLNSPLFLFAISPRLRFEDRNARDPSLDAQTTPDVDVRRLAFQVGHDASSCFTQLRYGASVLIEARHLNQSCDKDCKKSLEWFHDEVEFLGYEYRAREEVTADILGRELVRVVKSKFMRLKVGRQGLLALEKGKECGVGKQKKLKLKLRLWKDAVEG